jgi:hypothetical protein
VFDSVGAGDGAVAANGFAALDLRTGAWETTDGGLWWMGGPGEGRALALLGDRLLVGGSFDRAGTVQTASLAALDLATGAWTGFGAGMMNGEYGGPWTAWPWTRPQARRTWAAASPTRTPSRPPAWPR